jgi:hypothetical protein
MKTIRFYQTPDTEYLIGVEDRRRVRVIYRDREDADNYNAITLKEFYETAGPAALGEFELLVARAVAGSYDALQRHAAKNLCECFTLDELQHLVTLPEVDPRQKLNSFQLGLARKILAEVDAKSQDAATKAA